MARYDKDGDGAEKGGELDEIVNGFKNGGAAGSDFKAELEQQSALCISISEVSKHAPDLLFMIFRTRVMFRCSW
jgi:hypothetical protein